MASLFNQRLWAIEQFRKAGKVSRNHALRNFISRLGAIRKTLEEQGWHIEGAPDSFGDYWYYLVHKPGMEHSVEWPGVTFQEREYVCPHCPPFRS